MTPLSSVLVIATIVGLVVGGVVWLINRGTELADIVPSPQPKNEWAEMEGTAAEIADRYQGIVYGTRKSAMDQHPSNQPRTLRDNPRKDRIAGLIAANEARREFDGGDAA
jgi:hypothetical protein